METISSLRKRGNNNCPYSKAVKACIIDTKEEKDTLIMSLADETASIKATYYDQTLHPKLRKKTHVIIGNFTKGYNSIILKPGTKVVRSTSIHIPKENVMAAVYVTT